MNDVLAQTEAGREIARRNWERGWAQGWKQGWAEGWKQGWEQGHVEAMQALLQARFGDVDDLDDLDQLARRLSGYDYAGNIAVVVDGATLAELWCPSCSQIALPHPS